MKALGHSRTLAHSIQCSGNRGVLAMVQIGKTVGGVNMSICEAIRFSFCNTDHTQISRDKGD